MCQALKALTDAAIEQVSRGVHSKISSMDQEAIKGTKTFSIDLPSYREVLRLR